MPPGKSVQGIKYGLALNAIAFVGDGACVERSS